MLREWDSAEWDPVQGKLLQLVDDLNRLQVASCQGLDVEVFPRIQRLFEYGSRRLPTSDPPSTAASSLTKGLTGVCL